MDNKYPPIDLDEVTHDRPFAQLALLVDREDFLNDLYKAREELIRLEILPKSLLTYKQTPTWENLEPLAGITHYDMFGIALNYFPYVKRSDILAEQIRSKYKRTPNYHKAIKYAILCGKVTDNEYSSAYLTFVDGTVRTPHEVSSYFRLSSHEPQIAIVISPETKIDEIQQAYDNEFSVFKEIYKKNFTDSSELSDTHSAIKNHRKWYWMYKKFKATPGKKKGYGTILKIVKSDGSSNATSISTIQRGIEIYESRLIEL